MKLLFLSACAIASAISLSSCGDNTSASVITQNDDTVGTIVASDFARTRERFDASVYGLIWNHAILEKVRSEITREDARSVSNGQPSFLKLLNNLKNGRTYISSTLIDEPVMGTHMPMVQTQVDIDTYTSDIWTFLEKDYVSSDAPTGADGALSALSADNEYDPTHIARFGSEIVFANSTITAIDSVETSSHDIDIQFSVLRMFKLISSMPDLPDNSTAEMQSIIDMYTGMGMDQFSWNAQIIDSGIKEHMSMSFSINRPEGSLDPEIFASLPQGTLVAGGMKFAGAWAKKEMAKYNLADMAGMKEADAMFAPFGTTYLGFISSIDGSALFAITPGVPFPAATVAIPRSTEFDKILTSLLEKMQQSIPDENTAVSIAVPNVPVMVQLGRSDSHWILSSDAITMQKMLKHEDGEFKEGTLGKLLPQHCGADTTLAAFYDTKAILTLANGYMMFLPDPELRTQAADLITQVSTRVQAGYLEGRWTDDGAEILGEGFFGTGLFLIPVVAGTASVGIPNLLESKITANEAATAATLKASLFPSQVTFQAAGYNDADQNGTGRYGFISELAGNIAVVGAKKGDIRILSGPLADGNYPAITNNYYFKVYLPNGDTKAFSSAAEINGAKLDSEGQMENEYVIYAWPKDANSGRKIFAICQDGQVRSPVETYDHRYDDTNIPPWNLAFGENGSWGKGIAWPMINR